MIAIQNQVWVERLRSSGDKQEDAIAQLRQVLLRGLMAVCRDRYDSRIQAEDVVQETLLVVLNKIDTFEGRSKFTTWALTIAIRLAVSQMRRKRFRDTSIETLIGNGIRFEPTADPYAVEDLEEKAILLAKLKELIETELSEKQRNAVCSLLHGMPVEVFAEKTGSNRKAVYKLVHDARLKLRKGFEAAGFQANDIQAAFS